MLPADFQWHPRYQNAPAGELVLRCGDLGVAQLMQKVGGDWYVLLVPTAQPMGPFWTRDCSSREAGIAGIEAWAARHADRLRAQAAIHARRATLARHPGAPSLPVVDAKQACVEGAVGKVDHTIVGQVD